MQPHFVQQPGCTVLRIYSLSNPHSGRRDTVVQGVSQRARRRGQAFHTLRRQTIASGGKFSLAVDYADTRYNHGYVNALHELNGLPVPPIFCLHNLTVTLNICYM